MAKMEKYKLDAPFLNLDMGLGEAPFYNQETGLLRWVDIAIPHLYTLDTKIGPSSLQKFQLPSPIGSTAEIEGHKNPDEFIFAGKRGFGIGNVKTGQLRHLVDYWGHVSDAEEKARLERKFRGNDGAVDAKGRYFVGVMCDPAFGDILNEGTLFRLDPDLSLHKVKQPVAIPNGISWSLDNKWVYFTESTSGKIHKYPYNLDTGDIDFEREQVFWTVPVEGGAPDGHAQDADGNFWIAVYGIYKVYKVNTSGIVIAEIDLPTRCVTCPAIAGQDLYITTAKEDSPEENPQSIKHQGGLYRLDIGVKGSPLNKFKPLKPL